MSRCTCPSQQRPRWEEGTNVFLLKIQAMTGTLLPVAKETTAISPEFLQIPLPNSRKEPEARPAPQASLQNGAAQNNNQSTRATQPHWASSGLQR